MRWAVTISSVGRGYRLTLSNGFYRDLTPLEVWSFVKLRHAV